MNTELQVQENARRFATTRDVYRRQVENSLLARLDDDLARIARWRRAGDVTRHAALVLTIAVLADAAAALAPLESRKEPA